jgi:Type II secretion system (T2SS), protein G
MPPESPPATPSKYDWRQLAVRLVIASAVGLTVTVLSFRAAWKSVGAAPIFGTPQFMTTIQITIMSDALTSLQQSNQPLPVSLSGLNSASATIVAVDKNGNVVDGWNHPFAYTHNATSFEVTSFGRDGMPGGVGLDCDLSTSQPRPPQAAATLSQFIFDLPTGGLIATCVASGIAAVGLTLFLVRAPRLTLSSVAMVAVKCIATIIGALIAAAIISVAHIPSGH